MHTQHTLLPRCQLESCWVVIQQRQGWQVQCQWLFNYIQNINHIIHCDTCAESHCNVWPQQLYNMSGEFLAGWHTRPLMKVWWCRQLTVVIVGVECEQVVSGTLCCCLPSHHCLVACVNRLWVGFCAVVCRPITASWRVWAGCEWDFVLLSAVRSLPQREIDSQPSDRWRADNLGLVTDEHQLNVALTRARQGLIIIGMYCVKNCHFNTSVTMTPGKCTPCPQKGSHQTFANNFLKS